MDRERNVKSYNRLAKKWSIVPMMLAVLAIIISIISLVLVCCVEQKTESILSSNMDSMLEGVKNRAGILFHVNMSTLAVASSLKSTKINFFDQMEKKVAPRLFIALLTTQLASQVSYIRKDGLAFSYERENDQIKAILLNNSSPCSLYTQNTDQETGVRYGDINVLECNKTKQRYLDAINGDTRYESVNGENLLFFTSHIEDVGAVLIGVNLKDLLKYVSGIGFFQGHLFYSINGSALNRTLVPLDQNGGVLNDTDSSYEHLSNKYKSRSTQIDLGGISLDFTLAFHDDQIMTLFGAIKILILSLFFLTVLFLVTLIFIIIKLLKRSKIQETILRADLIKQKEAVQQAERKSMNKSMAFAQASHDVRNSLYSIIGLIDNCRAEVAPDSELATDLEGMKSCSTNLLGLLNTILDTSKVESGKMQLQVTEFDISKLIEESVDLFNVYAHSKGVELIWDPCDFSVLKLGKVRGDAMRFKQVLDNLLGNAVKFTNEGTIVVRSWAKKSDLKFSSISSDYGFSFWRMFCSLSKRLLRNRKNVIDQQGNNATPKNDPFSLELTFEVDDSGVGIPVEKRASVFENYVQVKDDSLFMNKDKENKPQGTGLGLGIVQSFVRLMGGEISIQDKERGKQGTCFRFNVFLNSSEFHEAGVKDETTSQIPVFNEANTVKGVHSLLFVRGRETKNVLRKWMDNLEIKVWVAQEIEHISPTLERIKHNLNASSKSDSILFSKTFSRNNSSQEKEGFLSTGRERQVDLAQRKAFYSGMPLRILIVVDISHGDLLEIWTSLRDFIANNPYSLCKVACIFDLNTTQAALQKFKTLPNCDLTLKKPVHGSKLQSLSKLIQELEQMDEGDLTKETNQPLDENRKGKQSAKQTETVPEIKIKIEDEKLLSGMNILYADDNFIMRRVETKRLIALGATVELAEDGLVALNLVKQALETGITRGEGDTYSFTYDFILMDCQMPNKSGYEATEEIRKEEKRYGIHVPIIALTASDGEDGARKAALAGMDYHMSKPLERNKLLEALGRVLGNKR